MLYIGINKFLTFKKDVLTMNRIVYVLCKMFVQFFIFFLYIYEQRLYLYRPKFILSIFILNCYIQTEILIHNFTRILYIYIT